MAIEVAKQMNTEKLILIATAKTRNEIPFYYRFAGRLKLHEFIPAKLLKRLPWANWFFGANTTFERELLRQVLHETDSKFLNWAIDKIVRWENKAVPKNYIHIHGTQDRIFPIKLVSCNVAIHSGGHLMVLSHAEEVNKIIEEVTS